MNIGKFSITVGVSIILFILFLIVFAPFVTSYSPTKADNSIRFQPISKEHIMGTDNFGRDIFSRVLYGGRITLSLSLLAMIISGFIGTTVGIICALHYDKYVDIILMRFVDTIMAMPFIVVAMAISTFLGRGLDKLIITVIITGWASFARLSRSLTISIKYSPSLLEEKPWGLQHLLS